MKNSLSENGICAPPDSSACSTAVPTVLQGLEAPLVAASWCLLVDFSFGERIDWKIFFSLIPVVWAIYLFDRFYDTATATALLPERKRYSRDHPALLKGLILIAVLWAGGIAVFLPGRIWLQSGLIGAVTVVYFLMFRGKAGFLKSKTGWTSRFPFKEGMIGFCFAAALGVPFDLPISWLKLAVLGVFGTLCFLNCLIISRAEAEYDATGDPSAWFAQSDQFFPFRRVFLLSGLAIVLLLMNGLPPVLGWCLFSSNFLLGLIEIHTRKHPCPRVQTLCDAALWLPGMLGALSHAV